jgi:hypothetical protein
MTPCLDLAIPTPWAAMRGLLLHERGMPSRSWGSIGPCSVSPLWSPWSATMAGSSPPALWSSWYVEVVSWLGANRCGAVEALKSVTSCPCTVLFTSKGSLFTDWQGCGDMFSTSCKLMNGCFSRWIPCMMGSWKTLLQEGETIGFPGEAGRQGVADWSRFPLCL